MTPRRTPCTPDSLSLLAGEARLWRQVLAALRDDALPGLQNCGRLLTRQLAQARLAGGQAGKRRGYRRVRRTLEQMLWLLRSRSIRLPISPRDLQRLRRDLEAMDRDLSRLLALLGNPPV